jgi:hypothetical protein
MEIELEKKADKHFDYYCEHLCTTPSCEKDCYRNSETKRAYMSGFRDAIDMIREEQMKIILANPYTRHLVE